MGNHRLVDILAVWTVLAAHPGAAASAIQVTVELAAITCLAQQDMLGRDQLSLTWWTGLATCQNGACPKFRKRSGNLDFSMKRGRTKTPNTPLFEARLPGDTHFDATVRFYERDGGFDSDDLLGEWHGVISDHGEAKDIIPFVLSGAGARYEVKLRVRREKLKD
jgi:hypothetical protein